MPTWADIQRLAADLQRVQSADSEKKLSEANCIEVITKLVNHGAIDIVLASNGREYITKKHLVTEIKNECLANQGRITVTDLVALLNVNLENVEAATSVLIKNSDEFVLCAGELLATEFIDGLCKELNEKLKETGQLSILEISKSWDLPMDVFNHYVLPELGKKIEARKVEEQLYTLNFLQLQTNKLRACLAAVTKPTSISSIFTTFSIPESLFFNIWNDLASSGKLNGHVIGAKNNFKSYYVPRMHDMLVKSFVKTTFEAEGFIATSLLKKLSVNDAKSYFKGIFPKNVLDSCLFLESGVSTENLWFDALNNIKEGLSSRSYVNAEEALPAVLSEISGTDIDKLFGDVKKNNPNVKSVVGESYIIFDTNLVDQGMEALIPIVVQKAKADTQSIIGKMREYKSQQTVQKKNDDDESWGGRKKGKSVKKQSATRGKGTSTKDTYDFWSLVSLDKVELRVELNSITRAPAELLDEIFDEILSKANTRYKEEVESALTAVESTENKDIKKLIEERSVKAQNLYNQLVIFEEGLEEISDTVALELKVYLTKVICIEISQLALSLVTECPPSTPLSNKVRDEFINSIGDVETKNVLSELFTGSSNLEHFHDAVKDLQLISMMIRFPDKKKKAETFQSYKNLLKQKLSEESDPPTFLLTCLLYIFAVKKNIPVTGTGKYVGLLVKELNCHPSTIAPALLDELQDIQKLVVDSLKKKNLDMDLVQELAQKVTDLKVKVLNL